MNLKVITNSLHLILCLCQECVQLMSADEKHTIRLHWERATGWKEPLMQVREKYSSLKPKQACSLCGMKTESTMPVKWSVTFQRFLWESGNCFFQCLAVGCTGCESCPPTNEWTRFCCAHCFLTELCGRVRARLSSPNLSILSFLQNEVFSIIFMLPNWSSRPRRDSRFANGRSGGGTGG